MRDFQVTKQQQYRYPKTELHQEGYNACVWPEESHSSYKADKRNLERNTIPEDICWESRDDVERLTNKQLRLYLRQEGLMVSGNKAQLVERILKHADGSVARTFDEDIEDDDENMPSSSHDDTSSDSEEESTEYEGGSSGDEYVERSLQVLFIDDADIPEVV